MLSAGKNAKVLRFEVPLMVVADLKDVQAMRVVNELNNLGVMTYVLPESGLPKTQTNRAVALWDGAREGRKRFRMLAASRAEDAKEFPYWAYGIPWGVKILREMTEAGVRSCANQIRADFFRRFNGQIDRNKFPWGEPRKREVGPIQIMLPESADEVVRRLNAGPDFVAMIANDALRAELPPGSRISWYRTPAEPMVADRAKFVAVTRALIAFEAACAKLANTNDPLVRKMLLAGVELKDARLEEIYLHPKVDGFFIRRPDLHWSAEGKLAASENDEMPGGFPDAFHIDEAYGLNKEAWKIGLDLLADHGPILFVVSDDWSRCYIHITQWFVAELQRRRYNALFATQADLTQNLVIDERGVTYRGVTIGTVWRQFPIFETEGLLADLVVAAHEGRVRMVPEFAHFGNKSWFAIFRKYRAFFREALQTEDDAVLEGLLPDSHLVVDAQSFPASVSGLYISSIEALTELSAEHRDKIVLKVAGANGRSARSYGVLMGHGLNDLVWREWIEERQKNGEPFIIQEKFATGIQYVPVQNLLEGRAELFRCRALVRPWVLIDGTIVSAEVCLVPSTTERVHGRVDMALAPLRLE